MHGKGLLIRYASDVSIYFKTETQKNAETSENSRDWNQLALRSRRAHRDDLIRT